jgi:hypothetical protein
MQANPIHEVRQVCWVSVTRAHRCLNKVKAPPLKLVIRRVLCDEERGSRAVLPDQGCPRPSVPLDHCTKPGCIRSIYL